MDRTTRAARSAALFAGILIVFVQGAAAAERSSADDTARLLAGMQPAAGSELQAHKDSESWKRHAKRFDTAWAQLEKRQISKIRTWTAEHITQRNPVLYYMFSGPDYLYADAFFPDAATYVLSGLEPVGPVPDVDKLSPRALAYELSRLQQSLNSVLSFSFFITKKMKTQLRGGRFSGTLPILYVFLARSGKSIRDVSLVKLDADGVVHADGEKIEGHADDGVKIVFSGKGGKAQTLYYFSTDISDWGLKRSGFLKFCEGLGQGDALLKSASYLLHAGNFSAVRNFILDRSDAIVQDDSGIPLRHFDKDHWQLHAFGNYLGPISIFPGKYQRDLQALFRKRREGPLDFGIGYRWRPRQSNLLLALKGGAQTAQDQ